MMAVDEEALICDLAQVYGVLDHETLPPWKVAIFAKGLPLDSRIKAAVFEKLAKEERTPKRKTLSEFEAERERFINTLKERGQINGDN